ncbi:folate-binding protein [Cyanobium sp. FGCU-52]|nr:folate-binding protein [Cyanobium sp. FGCU52]
MTPSSPADVPWDWRPAVPSVLERAASVLRLEGPDTLRVLHGQTSQALALARPGERLATCCIGPTARLRALAQVLVDDQGAWLVVEAGDAAAVHTALDRVLFPADAVRLGPPEAVRSLEVLGPDTSAAAPEDPGSWHSLDDGSGWRLDDGRLLLRDAAGLPVELATLPLLRAGEVERWRIQLGLPAVPGEINEEVNPFELGLAERVRLDKGCYVGQETLAKLATYDGVKQQLRRWFLADPGGTLPAPEPGTVLRADGGERAGSVTSILRLENDTEGWGGWIGLALVRRGALEAPRLRAGEGGAELSLSIPERFVAPPVGAGGQGGPQTRS